jgi:mycothiol synthase
MSEGLESRPMTSRDVTAWADLLAAIRRVDHEWEYFTADELLDEFSDPDRDFEDGSRTVMLGDRMVGYGALLPRTSADPVHDMRYEGGVHPEFRGRGIGSQLITWGEDAASALHLKRFPTQPLSLTATCTTTNSGALTLYDQQGFRPMRWFNGMIRDLFAPLPAVPAPSDVEIAGWSSEQSEAARMIRNESFRDHWGSIETTRERWDYFMGTATFRPQFSFLAYSEGETVGVVISHEFEGDPSARGRDVYVAIVGTLRAHRKRGIASALVARALNAAALSGFATGSLEVDAGSPTGALGLYEELGFRVEHTSVTVTKSLS